MSQEIIDFDSASGERLSSIYLCSQQWKRLPTKSKIPPSDKLKSFNVTSGKQTWLILDTYGNPDCGLSRDQGLQIFGEHFWKETIAINRKTGEVLKAVLYMDGEVVGVDYSIGLADFFSFSGDHPNLHVPKAMLARLDELASAKRPFAITLEGRDLSMYLDRDMTRNDLHERVRIRLYFRKGEILELSNFGSYLMTAVD